MHRGRLPNSTRRQRFGRCWRPITTKQSPPFPPLSPTPPPSAVWGDSLVCLYPWGEQVIFLVSGFTGLPIVCAHRLDYPDLAHPITGTQVRSSIVKVIVLTVATMFLAAHSATANFITNGSFESPVQPAGTFSSFSTGSTGITGWTVVGAPDVALVNSVVSGPLVFQAQSGNNLVDLTGNGTGNSGLAQSVSTSSLTSYDLTFFVGSATGPGFAASTVTLNINGVFAGNFTNPVAPNNTINWLQFTYQFTAPTALTTIEFRNGAAGNNFSALDNVALELSAVPEPMSMILGTAGLSMVVLTRAFKRRARTIQR